MGVFDDAEKAQHAVKELNIILNGILKWYEDNPDEAEELYEQWEDDPAHPEPTPIEKQLAREYNINWRTAIDWFNNVSVEILFDRLVILHPKWQVDYGPAPFDQLIEKFGGIGMVAGRSIGQELFGTINVSLRCHAPDTETANRIIAEKTPKYEHDALDDYIPDTIILDGTVLTFWWDLHEGVWQIEQLVIYLMDEGCTNIESNFEGKRYTQTDYHSLKLGGIDETDD